MIVPFKLYDRNSKRMIFPQDAQRMGIFLASDGTPVQVKGGTVVRLQSVDVLHYTGLVDTEKRPIWEQDIVDCDVILDFEGASSRIRGRGVATWDSHMSMFYVRLEETGLIRGDMDIDNMHVIGTTYG